MNANRRRSIIVGGALTILTLLLFAAALGSGSASIGLAELVEVMFGGGDGPGRQILLEWRLPRALFAALGGAALALSGAIFQFITRNPLGSPDIIGFSAGAYTGALLVSAAGVTALWGRPVGALVGGVGAGLTVYFLAWNRGLSGLRIIVVGIGVSVFLSSFSTYLLLTLQREHAMMVAGWGMGSLANIAWRHVVVLLVTLALCLPVLFVVSPDMKTLDLGDDLAAGLGVRVNLLRAGLLFLGTVLVAAVTAAAGPIAFVALAAPQLAKRATGAVAIPLYTTALMGATLLTASDLTARLILPRGQLPAGVVTLVLGGAYLLWLLGADTPVGLSRRWRPHLLRKKVA